MAPEHRVPLAASCLHCAVLRAKQKGQADTTVMPLGLLCCAPLCAAQLRLVSCTVLSSAILSALPVVS